MVSHVAIRTPDPEPRRKLVAVMRLMTPGLRAALAAVKAQGGKIPDMLKDA